MKALGLLFGISAIAAAAYFWLRPPTPRLAPTNTVLLLSYTSATTKTGVIGFPPGTALRIIENRGDKLRLTDGVNVVEVFTAETTNDLDLAQRAAQRDLAGQQSLAAQQEADRQTAVASLQRAETDRQLRAAQNQSAGVGGRSSALDQPASQHFSGAAAPAYYYQSAYPVVPASTSVWPVSAASTSSRTSATSASSSTSVRTVQQQPSVPPQPKRPVITTPQGTSVSANGTR